MILPMNSSRRVYFVDRSYILVVTILRCHLFDNAQSPTHITSLPYTTDINNDGCLLLEITEDFILQISRHQIESGRLTRPTYTHHTSSTVTRYPDPFANYGEEDALMPNVVVREI